jgi:hypothetical protein
VLYYPPFRNRKEAVRIRDLSVFANRALVNQTKDKPVTVYYVDIRVGALSHTVKGFTATQGSKIA